MLSSPSPSLSSSSSPSPSAYMSPSALDFESPSLIQNTVQVGSILYMAPELHKKEEYGKASKVANVSTLFLIIFCSDSGSGRLQLRYYYVGHLHWQR